MDEFADQSIERQRLIEANIDLPRRVAAAIHRRCRRYVDLEELVALGNLGLAEAGARFRAGAGASFRSFAAFRVRGAILDGIRRHSPLPTKQWHRLRAIRKRVGEEKTPSDDIEAELAAFPRVFVRSIEDIAEEELPHASTDAVAAVHWSEVRHTLLRAIDDLSARQRSILRSRYWYDEDLVRAGARLGLSKSVATREHALALESLRSQLHADPSAPTWEC
jgi:RNA polymerase sigma factor FliA